MAEAATRRRRWWLLALAALLLLAGAWGIWKLSGARCFQIGGDLTCRVETREPLVALTFDDGPTPEGVAAALDALARHDARATFFLIGGAMAENPGLAQRLVAAGHELGNHSYSHKRMMGLFASDHAREIARTDALLRREGQANPHLFRPPYGKKLTGLPAAVSQAGYRTIMWDVEDPPQGLTPRGYADRVLAQVRPGSIVLMHIMYKSRHTARDALPLILDGLARRGLRAVTVTELLAAGP